MGLYETVRDWCLDLWSEATKIWSDGGWAMYAIAVLAMVMFSVGMTIHLKLRGMRFLAIRESRWRHWIDHPIEREGHLGKLLDKVTAAHTAAERKRRFEQLRVSELKPFERDLLVMRICVSAAPLVGLLGTVTGMLATFGALSDGPGGDQTMAMVASGISEALITTETGLVIALPGLFFQYQLARRYERYRVFLAHLETVCTQVLHRDQKRAREEAVQEAARKQVAEAIKAGVLRRAAAPQPTA